MTQAQDVVRQFAELFQGNPNAIGTEEGGCERYGPGHPDLPGQFRWDLENHLRGIRTPIGVYPMRAFPVIVTTDAHWSETSAPQAEVRAEWKVRWGCIDFDEGDEESWGYARSVYLVLQHFGVVAWIERSRSKGYHVWVFADSWVAAGTMRHALLAACQFVDAPTKEINPKQSSLGEGQLGNYVRLPYPGWVPESGDHSMYRRVVVSPDTGTTIPLQSFVSRAYSSRVGPQGLESLAGAYAAPKRPIRRRQWSQLQGESRDRLRGKAAIIFNEGPIVPGEERGHTLWKLARYLREDGRHSYEEALVLLKDADVRWGKFTERGDEAYLEVMLQQAWS